VVAPLQVSTSIRRSTQHGQFGVRTFGYREHIWKAGRRTALDSGQVESCGCLACQTGQLSQWRLVVENVCSNRLPVLRGSTPGRYGFSPRSASEIGRRCESRGLDVVQRKLIHPVGGVADHGVLAQRVSQAIAFLASNGAPFVTRQQLVVDTRSRLSRCISRAFRSCSRNLPRLRVGFWLAHAFVAPQTE
jgi:hypothetical protein